jgi:hypothetical protein
LEEEMKIYLGRPITGLSFEEVAGYYQRLKDVLSYYGYEVSHAMTGKRYLRSEKEFKAEGYLNPLSTNHAITARDHWMTKQCDIFFLNLLDAKSISIGCMMELAWAFDSNKHVILVMEDNNVHNHAFVLETADVIFKTELEALEYLKKLIVVEI